MFTIIKQINEWCEQTSVHIYVCSEIKNNDKIQKYNI